MAENTSVNGWRVTVIYPLGSPGAEDQLQRSAEVTIAEGDSSAEIIEAARSADALITRGPAKVAREVIDACTRLRVIGTLGSGTDNVDSAYAGEKGIVVTSGAGVAPSAVAEYIVGAMVIGHRNFHAHHKSLLSGSVDWNERLVSCRGRQLEGTTLGIVGFGHIGRSLSQRARSAFGVKVSVFDPYVTSSETLQDAEHLSSMEALLASSQTVSVNVPLSEETRNLIGSTEMALIGPEGLLINTSRGGVVNQRHLVDALLTGKLGAAVIDVLDSEPPTGEDLKALAGAPNLLATPHIAGITDQSIDQLAHDVVARVMNALQASV